MSPSDFKHFRHAARQLVGYKPTKHATNFNVPKDRQIRKRYSPHKDIAKSTQSQLVRWMREDKHNATEGGSLFDAFVDTLDVVQDHVKDGADTVGKTLNDGTQALGSEVEKTADKAGLGKSYKVLDGLAKTSGTQIDVGADDLLHRIGLRQHRKYEDGHVSDEMRAHAILQKDAYLGINDRKGTDRFDYVLGKSSDKYAVYKDKMNEGKYVLAFRGTSPSQAIHNNDLIEDINIAAGNVRAISEYDSHVNMVKELLSEYGDNNLSLSGYSLGGAKAVALAREKDIRSRIAHTYAIAPGMVATDDDLEAKAHDSKISYVYHHNDAVANALLQHSSANHTVLYNEYDPLKSHLLLDELANM